MSQDTPNGTPDGATHETQSNANYYERHVFFCLNERASSENCCAHHHAQEAFERCKSLVKAAGLAAPGKVRVNKAGCLDRCSAGPVLVIYPEAIWYSYVDTHDIEEIVTSHLKNGQIVTRLLTPPEAGR
jgi:(2Fe-2S) ferredoxin